MRICIIHSLRGVRRAPVCKALVSPADVGKADGDKEILYSILYNIRQEKGA